MVLTKKVDERNERVCEVNGDLPPLPQAVGPQGDQNPHAVVELVLSVDVDAEST